MNTRKLEQSDFVLAFKSGCGNAYTEIRIPTLESTFKIEVCLLDGSREVSDKSLTTIADLQSMTKEHKDAIHQLLYDDAMVAKNEVAYGKPGAQPVPPPSLFERVFCRQEYNSRRRTAEKNLFYALDDPEHPCNFENGIMGMKNKVEWTGIRIDENELVEGRFALLDCYPAWEQEHGRTVVIRNGIPIYLGEYDIDLRSFN